MIETLTMHLAGAVAMNCFIFLWCNHENLRFIRLYLFASFIGGGAITVLVLGLIERLN